MTTKIAHLRMSVRCWLSPSETCIVSKSQNVVVYKHMFD